MGLVSWDLKFCIFFSKDIEESGNVGFEGYSLVIFLFLFLLLKDLVHYIQRYKKYWINEF